MTRAKQLEKEINKGIIPDEKSNTLINNWSPNNVRRLIIGIDYTIVQYFVTGGKYKKLIEVLNFKNSIENEMQKDKSEPQKQTSILEVLTKGRICSSIEEIVFCTVNYPKELLDIDSNIAHLKGSAASIEYKFPRLRHVSLVNSTVETVSEFARGTKEADKLLLDVLNSKGLGCKVVYEAHKEDWWRGMARRPKYYSLDADGGTLHNYFETLLSSMEGREKQNKLAQTYTEENTKALNSFLPTIKVLLSKNKTLLDNSMSIFDNATTLDKVEWASFLTTSNVCKGIKQELERLEKNQVSNIKEKDKGDKVVVETFIQEIRRINYDELITLIGEINQDNDAIEQVLWLKDLVFNQIFKGSQNEYLRSSNKATVLASLKTISKLATYLIGLQVNIVYLTLIKYLTRVSVEYVDLYASKLSEGQGISGLNYTRSTVEYCNLYTDGVARTALDKAGLVEVLSEDFKLPVNYNECSRVLLALKTRN
jgi:hypothetical protein